MTHGLLEHASWWEIISTISAFIGMCEALWAIAETQKDSMVLSSSGANGLRRVLADEHIRNENMRAFLNLILFIVGVVSCKLAPPPFPAGLNEDIVNEMIAQLTVSRIGLFLATMVMLLWGAFDAWARNLFMRHLTWGGKSKKSGTPADRKDANSVENPRFRADDDPN